MTPDDVRRGMTGPPRQGRELGHAAKQEVWAVGEPDAILDRTVFPLTEDELEQFLELLDAAPEPNEALRRFVRQRPPWARES